LCIRCSWRLLRLLLLLILIFHVLDLVIENLEGVLELLELLCLVALSEGSQAEQHSEDNNDVAIHGGVEIQKWKRNSQKGKTHFFELLKKKRTAICIYHWGGYIISITIDYFFEKVFEKSIKYFPTNLTQSSMPSGCLHFTHIPFPNFMWMLIFNAAHSIFVTPLFW